MMTFGQKMTAQLRLLDQAMLVQQGVEAWEARADQLMSTGANAMTSLATGD
jgi:hypothetical protein